MRPTRQRRRTPVWQLVFVNARLFFVGSDDLPAEAKIEATRDINKSLEALGVIVALIHLKRALQHGRVKVSNHC
jgi:hypothetical protein